MAKHAEAFMEMVTDALKEHVPQAASEALDKFKEEHEDPLVKGSLEILSEFVTKHGVSGIDIVAENLKALISGEDPMAVYQLQGDGLFLSDLVDELQSAEASRKEAANEMIDDAAAVLADVMKIVAKAVTAALAK